MRGIRNKRIFYLMMMCFGLYCTIQKFKPKKLINLFRFSKMKVKITILFLLSIFIFFSIGDLTSAEISVTEKVGYKLWLFGKVKYVKLITDENGKVHFMLVIRKPFLGYKREIFVLDGIKVAKFSFIESIIFSKKNFNYAFLGYKGYNQYLVINGKVITSIYQFFITPLNERLPKINDLKFNNNGKKLAFILITPEEDNDKILTKNYLCFYENGKTKILSEIFYPYALSSDLNSFAYAKKENNKICIYLNNEKLMEYSNEHVKEIKNMSFIQDTENLSFILIKSNGKYYMVINRNSGPEYDYINNIVFSPNGKKYAYLAYNKNKSLVVLNGIEGPKFEFIYDDMSFTPDSKHLVYIANQGGEKSRIRFIPPTGGLWCIVVDNSIIAKNSAIRMVDYNQTLDKFSYITNEGGYPNILFQAEEGNWFLIHNDKKIGPFIFIDNLTINQRNNNVAYTINLGGKWKGNRNYKYIKGGKWYLMLNDQILKLRYNKIYQIVEHGKGFYYIAKRRRKIIIGNVSLLNNNIE